MGGLNGCVVGCRGQEGKMSRHTFCVVANCHKRKDKCTGGGGRQYVLAEYVRYCKEMLKDGAEEGDWICVTCRNAVRSRASTLGVDLNGDAKVWLTRWRKLNLCLI